MQISRESVRILAAVVIAAGMIGVSFWLSSSKPKLASALSTDELLRAYVEQDTDQDGLPDWQEEVYGTDPANPSSVEPGMTDLDALKEGYVKPAYESEPLKSEEVAPPYVPGENPSSGSLTERFSTQFAQAYFAAGGGTNVSDAEQQQIINDLLAVFVREAAEDVASSYTRISLRIDSETSLDEYASKLATVLVMNDLPPQDADPVALTQAIMNNDADAVKKLAKLGVTYSNIRSALLSMPVSSEAADAHLALTRGFDTFARTTDVITKYSEDPLAALGALSAFEPTSKSMLGAFGTIATLILREGEPEPGTAAAMLVNIARSSEQP